MANDELIRDFFHQMKAEDQRIPIPEFPEVKTGGLNWWIPLGVAATLVMGGFIWLNKAPDPELHSDVIIISLEKGEDDKQEFTIEEKAFIDTWESSSASLLTEF